MPVPEPTQLLLIRHGQTAWNAAQRIQGHRDLPLDAIGHWQADRLADVLAEQPLAALYSSDLLRASQTAAPVARRLGLSLQTDVGLRERAFGVFEGERFADIASRWPAAAESWRRRDPDFAPDGGEGLRAFQERCVAAVCRLAARHAGQVVGVVTHGGVLDGVYRAASGASLQAPRTWALVNAAINRLLWTPQGLVVVGWNDAAHLDDETRMPGGSSNAVPGARTLADLP